MYCVEAGGTPLPPPTRLRQRSYLAGEDAQSGAISISALVPTKTLAFVVYVARPGMGTRMTDGVYMFAHVPMIGVEEGV